MYNTKLSQTQKLLQKLSPQQIQLIKLLEIPTMELEQRIKRELEENPVLEDSEDIEEPIVSPSDENNADDIYKDAESDSDSETGQDEDQSEPDIEEFSLEDYIDDDYNYSEDYETPDYKLNANNYSPDEKRVDIPFAGTSTFHEHLTNQVGLRDLTANQRILAEYIIGNIDDDGYLRRELESIVDDVAFTQNISTTEEELEDILKLIQDFDPAGVGARDLQECLLLQIKRKLHQAKEKQAFDLAYRILNDFFNEFTKKHFKKISTRLDITDEEMKLAMDEILKLNPKPGSSFSDSQSKNTEQITPDFILEMNDGKPDLHLNSRNNPDLRINSHYARMLEDYNKNKKNATKSNKEAVLFVKQKMDSAKWFIDAIRQRQNTLILTMNAILQYQKEYFIEGDETKMRPMILKDIAEKTGLDISTISRVANSKYIQTHFGIMPLKYFFSEGMQTDSGEEVSTREIKSILQDCIGSESKKKPMTDEKLSKILKQKGYQIARRTVAKYREQLGIPVARLRKKLE